MYADVELKFHGQISRIQTTGNGRLNAVTKALEQLLDKKIHVVTYEEHSLTSGSTSQAIAYVGLEIITSAGAPALITILLTLH